MKLNMLFIVMDLLTVLAYPIVFVHGKLSHYLKQKESIHLPNSWVAAPIVLER